MKTSLFSFILAISCTLLGCVHKKEDCNTVKNVIILIPDGTSTGLVSLSRWYNDNEPLAIDPHICGWVRTHNADGKIPDSAPASTAYATGVKTKAPYIGLNGAAEPRASVLELARRKGLATGIVATCEFPHATPADFVCHFNNRDSKEGYKNLSKQFINNSPNLVFAGGKKYLDENDYHLLLLDANTIKLITTKKSFERQHYLSDTCIWALFPDWQDSTRYMSYECDRNRTTVPSLSEMTEKAIQLLSQNKNGFFLMVEGSQIDWAAHDNDPYAAVNDFLAFDKAVAVALKFAQENKNTVVIVCPDHGTGGITIGNYEPETKNQIRYDKVDIQENVINPMKQIKWSGRKLAEMMLQNSAYISKDSLKKYYNTEPAEDFLNTLKLAAAKKNRDTIPYLLGRNFSRNNYIGWTSTGHTAEDVFLAIYAPKHIHKLTGVVDNYEIGRYIGDILALDDFDATTEEWFVNHLEFFKNDEIVSLNADSLVVNKNGKKFTFEANSKVMKINGEPKKMPSLAVRIDSVYYLPKSVQLLGSQK